MREHHFQPKRRRRFVATTAITAAQSFPDLARGRMVNGPNKLWVADILYRDRDWLCVLAAILDAWSRPRDRLPGPHPVSTGQVA